MEMSAARHQHRRRIGGVSPASFLRVARGGPRGFWASGERWVAHAGVAEDVSLPTGGSEQASSACRFATVEERVRAAFGGCEGSGVVRAFGGTDIQRQSQIILNYFRAIDDIFVDGRERTDTVVYKSTGLFFFLGVSKWVFNVIYSSSRDFRVNSISAIITGALDHLDDDAARSLPDPDWWMPGPIGASTLNRTAATHYIGEFQRALAQSRASQDIQL